jgi:hypothetical protein
MAGHERRRAGRCGLGCDHAERFREHGWHDRHVRQREQVGEMAVVQRTGEERPLGRLFLELPAIVAEANDHRARIELLERFEEHVDALVVQKLPEVDDGWRVGCEERRQPFRITLVRQAFARVPGIRRIGARLGEQSLQCELSRFGLELVHVDAGRNLVHAVDVTDDLLENVADVGRPDEHRPRGGERRAAPLNQVGIAAHGVLELGSMRLDGERKAARVSDRGAEQDVVREDHISGEVGADRGRVQGDIAVTFPAREVLEELRLDALIAVQHEDRQQAADVRPEDPRTS